MEGPGGEALHAWLAATGAIVEERKRKLDGRVLRFACRAVNSSQTRAILLYLPRRAVTLCDGAVQLPADAITFGLYWIDRPYNLYQWVDRTGAVLAVYANVATETVIDAWGVQWLDLELDLLITPDLRVRICDADEVPRDLAPSYRTVLAQALAQLTAGAPDIVAEAETATQRYRREWAAVRARGEGSGDG